MYLQSETDSEMEFDNEDDIFDDGLENNEAIDPLTGRELCKSQDGSSRSMLISS